MPAPFLPLLGGAARVLGSRAVVGAMSSGLGRAFRGGGGEQVDVNELARKLGTPRPSQKQVQDEQLRKSFDSLRSSSLKAATAIGGVAAIGPAAYGATRALEGFGGAILDRRRELTRLNTGIAAAFARIDRQDITLGVRTGAGAEASTVALADSFRSLREDMQPLKESMTRVNNLMALGVVKVAGLVASALEPIGEGINFLLDKIDALLGLVGADSQGIQGDLRNFFRQSSRGNFGHPYNRDPEGDD